jgi:signal transduction histidine kinase
MIGAKAEVPGLCLGITEHSPFPMAVVEGARHVVRSANPAFCRLMHKPVELLVGTPFCELLPGKNECLEVLDRVYRTGKPESHTELGKSQPIPGAASYTMWPMMEEEIIAAVAIQMVKPADERAIAANEALLLGSLRQHELTEAADLANTLLQAEIAERQRVELALRRAQALLLDRAGQLEGEVTQRTSELAATNQQLEAFVYSIAHDLRAPLRSLQGFSELLVEEAGATLGETCREYTKQINKLAYFMDALLSDLLAFSRISQQHVELASVSLQADVAAVLSQLSVEVREQNISVEHPGTWPSVMAHEPTLIQVLFNLVSNALKFAVPGVPPKVRLRAQDQGEFIRVWVEDNGIGIAPGHHDQIFKVFTRLQSGKFPGTGIGLAIVRKGVERMGGCSGVESALGQGSRFWFELRKA